MSAPRILLCEDDMPIRRATRFKFSSAGFDVSDAEDGEAGWELLQQQRPDFLITDCQMPRLDGIGLLERIRADERLADLPVILLTAKAYETTKVQRARDLGVLEVISKPFSPRDLLNFVQEHLGVPQ